MELVLQILVSSPSSSCRSVTPLQVSLAVSWAATLRRCHSQGTPPLLARFCTLANFIFNTCSTIFGAKKSLAGTLAAVMTGAAASYVFWSTYAARGDEADLSWLPGRLASTWHGLPSAPPTRLPRLPSPNSTLSLEALALVNGVTAGIAEAFDLWGLDDNFSLPVLFGLMSWAIMTGEAAMNSS